MFKLMIKSHNSINNFPLEKIIRLLYIFPKNIFLFYTHNLIINPHIFQCDLYQAENIFEQQQIVSLEIVLAHTIRL